MDSNDHLRQQLDSFAPECLCVLLPVVLFTFNLAVSIPKTLEIMTLSIQKKPGSDIKITTLHTEITKLITALKVLFIT